MENRRKEILTKKLDIGLLATVQCPREEPDRSLTLCRVGLTVRTFELHSQSSREALQQILSLAMPFLCLSIFTRL